MSDPGAAALIDYHGLPGGGPGAWPGRAGARSVTEKAAAVEEALCIAGRMGASFGLLRFTPYVSMREFEALLFSDCERFGAGMGKLEAAPRLQDIRNAFVNPGEIDDSPATAPSKRLKNLLPEYENALF